MTNTVRWGVLSTAKIGREHVIPGTLAAANCDVVAIAGRDGARARRVADSLGIARSHASYEALLDDPDVDAVYIPLPNHLHMEWTIRAAEAGKHVLCEKPLALSPGGARRMVDACADAGVVFMEAFMYRLHPAWNAVVDMVQRGRIGDLVSIQSWFSYYNDDPSNIRNVPEYGGGALMDIGCYSVNLSRLLFDDEPRDVAATITRDPSSGVDIVTSAVLEFADGTSTFTCSTRTAPDQRVHIYGTHGRISFEIPFNSPPELSTSVWIASGGDPTVETVTFEPVDQYRLQAEQFARAVLAFDDVPIPSDDGIANMVAIERIVKSAEARS